MTQSMDVWRDEQRRRGLEPAAIWEDCEWGNVTCVSCGSTPFGPAAPHCGTPQFHWPTTEGPEAPPVHKGPVADDFKAIRERMLELDRERGRPQTVPPMSAPTHDGGCFD